MDEETEVEAAAVLGGSDAAETPSIPQFDLGSLGGMVPPRLTDDEMARIAAGEEPDPLPEALTGADPGDETEPVPAELASPPPENPEPEERDVPIVLFWDRDRDLKVYRGDHVIVGGVGRRDGAIARGREGDEILLERKDERATQMRVDPSQVLEVTKRFDEE